MSNVRKAFRVNERKIKDMLPNEMGWTVPWAYRNGELDENYSILYEKCGTVRMRVFCIEPHVYDVEFVDREPNNA